jgi:hypothetical protein
MSVSAEICRLLERAKPMRLLPPDEAESAGLGRLVDQINALRKQEADAERELSLASIKANLGAPDDEPEKRKPGRPRKAD